MKNTLLITICFLLIVSNLFSQFDRNPLQRAGRVINQGITSKIHEKNIGKIVWSKSRIKFDKQDEAILADEFKSGDAIYGRGYLEDCLYNLSLSDTSKNCVNKDNFYELRIKVDGVEKGVFNSSHFSYQNWTTFQISLVLSNGDIEDPVNKGVTEKWNALVNSLSAGKHSIILEFWGGKEGCKMEKYAAGSFTFLK